MGGGETLCRDWRSMISHPHVLMFALQLPFRLEVHRWYNSHKRMHVHIFCTNAFTHSPPRHHIYVYTMPPSSLIRRWWGSCVNVPFRCQKWRTLPRYLLCSVHPPPTKRSLRCVVHHSCSPTLTHTHTHTHTHSHSLTHTPHHTTPHTTSHRNIHKVL